MAGLGQSKTGGRTKDTPNKTTAAIKDAVLSAFEDVGGKDYLVSIAKSDPRVFCTLLGKLIPAEVRTEVAGDDLPKLIIRDYTGRALIPESTDA